MKILLFVLLCFNAVNTDSYGQWITWQKTYGDWHINEGFSIVQLPDGGYFAVGRDAIGGIEKGWLLRLNQYGDTLWTKFIMDDMPWKIIKTSNDNFVVVGRFTTIVKIDINGIVLWTSGPYRSNKYFDTINRTIDGGYMINGRIDFGAISYPYLFKISSTGDSLWEKIYTDSIFDGAFYDMDITLDNNFILIGNISDSSYITDKLTIMKIDQAGNVIWNKRYDSLKYYITRSIRSTIDGSFIVAGSFFYCKFSGTGDMTWLKIYDTINFVDFRSVSLTNDGSYIFTGAIDTIGNYLDYVFLLKTDTTGNELCHKLYGFNNTADRGNEVNQTSDSGYVIIGNRNGFQMGDIYIIKTDKHGFANPPIGILPNSNSQPKIYSFLPPSPNPSNPEFTIKFDLPYKSIVNITVYDVLGRVVLNFLNSELITGSYTLKINLSNFASGLYFVKLFAVSNDLNLNRTYSKTHKLVLIK